MSLKTYILNMLRSAILILFLFTNSSLFCQIDSKESLVSKYYHAVGDYSRLYTGVQYINYDIMIEGDQFFPFEEGYKTSLTYMGNDYENITLLYDTHLDEVLIVHDKTLYTKLIKSEVDNFTIDDHHFIHLTDIDKSKGIYELLYTKNLSVLVKHHNEIEETIKGTQVIRSFVNEKSYYILRSDSLVSISKKNSFLQFFGGDKKKIKNFIKKERLNFNKDKQNTIIQSITYYETLP